MMLRIGLLYRVNEHTLGWFTERKGHCPQCAYDLRGTRYVSRMWNRNPTVHDEAQNSQFASLKVERRHGGTLGARQLVYLDVGRIGNPSHSNGFSGFYD